MKINFKDNEYTLTVDDLENEKFYLLKYCDNLFTVSGGFLICFDQNNRTPGVETYDHYLKERFKEAENVTIVLS